MTIASTGLSESTLKRLNKADKKIDYDKIYLHPNQHVSYYPGSNRIHIKMLFGKKDGKILVLKPSGRRESISVSMLYQ